MDFRGGLPESGVFMSAVEESLRSSCITCGNGAPNCLSLSSSRSLYLCCSFMLAFARQACWLFLDHSCFLEKLPCYKVAKWGCRDRATGELDRTKLQLMKICIWTLAPGSHAD